MTTTPSAGKKTGMVWLAWTFANAAGGAGAGAAVFLVGDDWNGLALAALIFSVPQWIAIREHVGNARAWIPITVLGVLAGYVCGAFAFIGIDALILVVGPTALFNPGFALGLLMSGLVFGTVLGFGHWMIFRRHFTDARVWIPSSAVGAVALNPSVRGLLEGNPSLQFRPESIAIGLLGGIIYGAVTGVTLAWLSRRVRV
jgi:hypothetical protein